MSISAAIITLNEEANIERCLKSIEWVDEIIIVDSGSTDRTIEIARKYTDKIFYQEWLGYAEQRNVSFDKVTEDWILIIDADEEVTPELRDEISCVIKQDTNRIAYSIIRKNFFMDKILSCYVEKQLRIFKKDSVKYCGLVHERPIFDGSVGYLSGVILHYQYRNIDSQINKLNKYSTLVARMRFQANKSCGIPDIVFRPLLDFIKHYIFKRGFWDGLPGFVFAILHSYYTFAKLIKLYELNINKCRPTTIKQHVIKQ